MPKRLPSRTAAAAAARRIDMTGVVAVQSRIHCPNEFSEMWDELTPREKGQLIRKVFLAMPATEFQEITQRINRKKRKP
jgi:hypothetical protein